MRVVVCGVKDHDGLLVLASIDVMLKRVKELTSDKKEEGRKTIYINPSSSPDVVINPSNCTTSVTLRSLTQPRQTYQPKPTFDQPVNMQFTTVAVAFFASLVAAQDLSLLPDCAV